MIVLCKKHLILLVLSVEYRGVHSLTVPSKLNIDCLSNF